jgi:PEGA domain-containing protein
MRIPQFRLEPVEIADDSSQSNWKKWAALAAALVVLIGAGAFAAREFLAPASTTTTGTVVFTTNPPGAQVVVDGVVRGVTPITLTVTSGPHKVDLHGANGSKTTAVSVAAGTQVAQYIELPHAAPAATGQLQVRTEPAGAKVSVDGVARGAAPTMVADLSPGEHAVVLESDLGSIKQTVTIEAGVTASLVVPLAAPEGAPVSGWIAVASRVELQLYEKDRLLGTSRTDRLMVSAGKHEIDLVNDDLGYRTSRTVQVPAGKVATVNPEMPNGSIAINATPWAEVWIDGNKVGETPIGNLTLPIGSHDVVFRHPELGEQHHTATVSLKDVARLSVDLRKP